MGNKRVLLMYISKNSGHHQASIAVETALRELDSGVETLNINSLNYTNPILGNIINRTYMSVIRRTPEVWGYLYDNPKVVKNTRALKEAINRYSSSKLKGLLENFRPQGIVCTQAFPCGMVAQYKKSSGFSTGLFGVLTDFAPHSYWIYEDIDVYFVPSDETGQKLVDNGVPAEKIMSAGIPIKPVFTKFVDKGAVRSKYAIARDIPVILIMGGSQGLGPISEMAHSLDKIRPALQIIIVCGDNKRLFKSLKKRERDFKKRLLVLPYVEEMHEIMDITDIIITKPGGITTAESLAKGLCMLVIRPIPGQEEMNTNFLLKNKAAIKADSYHDVSILVDELLRSPSKLEQVKQNAKKISRPESAFDIARRVLEVVR